MKLPWNKKYLVISFHIIVTFIIIYASIYAIDSFAYVMTNLKKILNALSDGIGVIISVFSTVVIAFVISYLFDPVVDFFQKKYDLMYTKYILPNVAEKKLRTNRKKSKKDKQKDIDKAFNSRAAGTSILYLTILLIFVIISWISVDKISSMGGSNIIDNSTILVDNTVRDFSVLYTRLENLLKEWGIFEFTSKYVFEFLKSITGFVSNLGSVFIDFISTFATGLVNVLISLVIAFYFLKDKDSIKAGFNSFGKAFLPVRCYNFINNTLGDINAVFSGYIRGQLLDASIMATLISIGLSLIGVRFSVIIGIIAGFSNVIPYFGALMGFILAISVSILSGEPMKAVYSVVIMLILQQVDTIFIVPKVVGESVELSPVLVIIALSVAGQLFGIVGMIFAVPVFATIKLFATRIYHRQRLKKELSQIT